MNLNAVAFPAVTVSKHVSARAAERRHDFIARSQRSVTHGVTVVSPCASRKEAPLKPRILDRADVLKL